MNQEKLNKIIESHKKWLNGEHGGERADLTYAALTYADLTGADLTRADLTYADLTYADLTRANIDYSSWPLWCGSINVIVDTRISRQLAYHLLSVIGDDMDEFIADPVAFANRFHRVKACGMIGYPVIKAK